MAGEDTQILANETVDSLTIISPNSKLLCGPGNGVICNGMNNRHNNNGLLPNGKPLDEVIVSNGKSTNATNEGIERDSNVTNTDFDNEDVSCGWGPCTPKWMRCFASKQAFLVTFCITWVLQGMYYTYFVSVITTIEKLFQIQSKTTGIIMSATEIGQIGSSLLLTYYGGQGHRPKWIAWGMVLFAVSSFCCSMPHFIFGNELIERNENLFNGVHTDTQSNTTEQRNNLCTVDERWDNITARWATTTPLQSIGGSPASTNCKGDLLEQRGIQSKITTIVLAIFFVSLLGVGMGQTAVYTLGIPYIDDNVASRESPLYFAITIGVRILGPALGFVLGSFCTMLYADLSANPQITPKDPRWVGAWWLGLVLVSTMLMLASIPMFAFPSRLPSSKAPPRRDDANKPSLKDFPKAVKRLLKNDILMFRTASSVLHILPIAGLYTFLPKYLESQFRLPAYHANMISGVGGILVMGLGIVISGVFILKVKPNARFVAAWIAFTAIVYAIGMGTLMFIGCPMDDFAGLQLLPKKDIEGNPVSRLSSFDPPCNLTCSCDLNIFNPICGADGKTYFSDCHAGCANRAQQEDGKVTKYSDCQCIGLNSTSPSNETMNTAIPGYCKLQCNNFWVYMTLFSIFVFIHSTSEVGSMLLILRCVDPRDKAMALGLIQFAIGLFGNVPCPIVYGAVVDSACLVWDAACGQRGACWLYDSNVFRMFYHGTTGGILACAFVMDLVVWYKAGSITFVDETEEGTVEEMVNLKKSDQRPAENDYL